MTLHFLDVLAQISVLSQITSCGSVTASVDRCHWFIVFLAGTLMHGHFVQCLRRTRAVPETSLNDPDSSSGYGNIVFFSTICPNDILSQHDWPRLAELSPF